MKKTTIRLFALLVLGLSSVSAMAENLFKTLLGKTDAEVQARIEQTWNHFFTPGDLTL